MNLTDYHAKYYAHELSKRCPPDSVEKLAGAVASAQVDLIEPASSRGGPACLPVATVKRRILVITPSNLRKQWYQELSEKFFLPSPP